MFQNKGAKTTNLPPLFRPRDQHLFPHIPLCPTQNQMHYSKSLTTRTTVNSRATTTDAATLNLNRPLKRPNYSCGRCGQPKRGHNCQITSTTSSDSPTTTTPAPLLLTLPPRHPHSRLRRSISFNENNSPLPSDRNDDDPASDSGRGFANLPDSFLWEVMKKLPPATLLSAGSVCKNWRNCVSRIWEAAEELKIRVPPKSQVGFLGSVLLKCSELVRLSLMMESDFDATMLACIAFSCPNLEAFEISMYMNTTNRITGDELGRFVAEKRSLSSVKIRGCSSLRYFTSSSSRLSTLWLSDLYCLSKMVLSCPNLKELSLEFSPLEDDSTDLAIVVESLGRTCPMLRHIHIASLQLSHGVVLALAEANFRNLCRLSLVHGSGILDASVHVIALSYPGLELLDLSGSSISDTGIGVICNELAGTLSRLLLALCPNITSSGVQFAAAELPLLELMDCGMTICDYNPQTASEEKSLKSSKSNWKSDRLQESPNNKLHILHQKLIIKHMRLKKLSLWGCSGLDALYLNCPELNDLNIISCSNLLPERLVLQCPSLVSVYASGCQDKLIKAVESQVFNSISPVVDSGPCKFPADGSKRVQVPHSLPPKSPDNKKRKAVRERRHTVHVE